MTEKTLPPDRERVASVHAGAQAEPGPAPAQVGPWRVIREVGRGGMGVVYLAERAEAPFQQLVALKVLRAGLVGDEARARFARERRILARLTHPAVVPLVDGGVAADGRPYLVMQYVDGAPITDDADTKRLGIPARLRQFMVVCRAVQHAHGQLVVHRDLKPSNILVDRDGTVRLLDFGIAKMLVPEAEETDAGITREVAAPLTPARAAPEQLRGEAPTMATDVWALGVLLHELTTGRLPHVVGGASLAAMADEITGRELTRLSRLVVQAGPAADGASPAARAAARGTTPERLARLLRGDLETIVAKALHPRPDRRYESAGALADDLGAYLDGRPVAARPDAIGYRVRRFVGRHKTATAAGALAAVAVGALTVGTLVQNARVTRERDRATAESAKARAVADLLVDLLRGSGPTEAARVDRVSVAELLARGVRNVDTLTAQPDVQSRLFHTLAQIRASRSEMPEAVALLERAVAAGAHIDDADPDRAAMLIDFATLLTNLGRNDDAKTLARRVRERLERRTPPPAGLLATALLAEGRALGNTDGIALVERALAMNRALVPSEPIAVASSLDALAGLTFSVQRDNARARAYWRESLALIEPIKGPDHVDTVTVLANLAVVLDDPQEAVDLNRTIVERRLRMFGPDALPLAFAQTNLGIAFVAARRYVDAEASLRAAQALWERKFGVTHPEALSNLRNVGRVQDLRADYAGALATFELLDARLREGRLPDVERAAFACYRAQVLRHLGKRDESERLLGDALAVLERAQPPKPYEVAEVHVELGRLAMDRGAYEPARRAFARALAIREPDAAALAPEVAEARAEIGRALVALGRRPEGRAMLEAALPAYDQWLVAHPADGAALRAALER